MRYRATRTTAPIMNGIVAGVFVGRVLSEGGLRRLSAQEYVRYHQETDKDLGRAMPLIGGAAVAASVVGFVAVRGGNGRALAGLALVCGIAEVASTLTVNEPINRKIQAWNAAEPPEQWADVRDRWERGHRVRTVLSIVGFACSVAAALEGGGTTSRQG